MAKGLSTPRGTLDVLPDEASRRDALNALAGELLGNAGYRRIDTPMFEATELFKRGVGGSTDIVRKEMYTFEDGSGRSLTLRPEGTATVARSYIEHGMHKLPQPVKLWYTGPFFRYERAQAGRQRQFAQIGAEVLGSDAPAVDAELIAILDQILARIGAQGIRLRLGSLGSIEARAEYRQKLVDFLRTHEDQVSDDVKSRIDENPLRAFDADDPATQEVMKSAPLLLDHLSGDDADHFTEVRSLLDAVGVDYEIDPTLVRGLDYYTRTVFEFTSDAL
ncbi:MAG: histidine--tRNA ligase, partial [Solirubrobacteraceae bacterium]|nr:histidine--tRNA ligase [Solirubrobacteraceae bacterium]